MQIGFSKCHDDIELELKIKETSNDLSRLR